MEEYQSEGNIKDCYRTDIIERVKAGLSSTYKPAPFRPQMSEIRAQGRDNLLVVIQQGWAEKPADRPTAQHMHKDLQRINPFKWVLITTRANILVVPGSKALLVTNCDQSEKGGYSCVEDNKYLEK